MFAFFLFVFVFLHSVFNNNKKLIKRYAKGTGWATWSFKCFTYSIGLRSITNPLGGTKKTIKDPRSFTGIQRISFWAFGKNSSVWKFPRKQQINGDVGRERFKTKNVDKLKERTWNYRTFTGCYALCDGVKKARGGTQKEDWRWRCSEMSVDGQDVTI